MNDKKEIDIDRFYWNPTKKEKIYSHYTNGEEIKLSEEDKKKAEEAKLACIKRSINEVKSDVNERKKPVEQRGRKAKIVEPKKE